MNDQINTIKSWLKTGSINIFGLPMSGKDTQGRKLAEVLDAKFLSSGEIIREKENEMHHFYTAKGALLPQNLFYEWVLPYFHNPDLAQKPLILSSIGRWSGEEFAVISTTDASNHPIKAVIILNVSEADVADRFAAAQILNDRGGRRDDADTAIFNNRLQEFRTKTLPVLQTYKDMNLLIEVNGDQPRDAVFAELLQKLFEFAQNALATEPTEQTDQTAQPAPTA